MWNKGIWLFAFLMFFLPASFLFAVDTDEDGISDDVELQLGSSPTHQDVFIEVDWLVVNGRSFRPRGNFIQMVTQFFASGDVDNPDGTQGIRAHVQLSQGIRTTGGTVGFFEPDGSYNWEDFDAIKNQFFTPSRRATHHYCLFVSDLADPTGASSGVSGLSRNDVRDMRKGASDFIVALGGPWFNYPVAGQYRWTQFGTFIHELGHNLGLMHGGSDNVSFKPNNFSVMSYCYQMGGIPITASDGKLYYVYDYGRFFDYHGSLKESALNEQVALGSAAKHDGIVYGARWFFDVGPNDYYETFDSSKNVDWNKDGKLQNNMQLNLNPGYDQKLTNLGSTTWDWWLMSLNGGQIGKARLSSQAILPSRTYLKCLSFNKAKNSAAKVDTKIPRVTYSEIQMKR
jgi:hypothetical protein